MARYESLLQHLGPAIFPISPSALEVIRFDNPHDLPESGLALVMIETNIPVLIPAPQAPQEVMSARIESKCYQI